MLQSTEIKPGMCFTWEGELYQAITVDRNKTAMAKMKVAVKVKSPRTGVVKELGLIGSDRVEEATIDRKQMQYLYTDGDSFIFMDNDTYEQGNICLLPEFRGKGIGSWYLDEMIKNYKNKLIIIHVYT